MRRITVLLAVLLGSFLFLFPTSANATGGGGLCSICNPTGLALESELAGGAGAAPSGEFAAIVNNPAMGVPGSVSGGPIVAAESAMGTSVANVAGLHLAMAGAGIVGLGLLGIHGFEAVLDSGATLPSGTVVDGISYGYSAGFTASTIAVTGISSDANGNLSGFTTSDAASIDVYTILRTQVTSYSADPVWSGQWAANSWQSGTTGYPASTYAGQYGPSTSFTFSCAASYYCAVKLRTSGLTWLTYVPPTVESNPNRWIEQTITCNKADGTTVTSTLTGPPSDFPPGTSRSVAGILCPAGTTAKEWTSTLKTDGGPDVLIQTITAPPGTAALTGCAATGVVCQVKLQYHDTPTTWKDCEMGKTGPCTNWRTSVAPSTSFRCQYGTGTSWSDVGLSSCSILDRAFQPDPTSSPYVPPQPAPGGGGCDLGGWSSVLDGSIIYKAVGCALVWAFVPSPETWQSVQTRGATAWSSSAVGAYVTAGSGALGSIASIGEGQSSTCNGLVYEFPILGAGKAPTEITLLDACHAPMHDIAGLSLIHISEPTRPY